ncbi:MAG: CRISPR system precrRNA processing endoribonuclease RAMP protein Cas6 [Myxococcota bacterium]|jgi:hypothetical protein|nr:CRISPR system precrRNA processing endoribonuclease RAMP protein Cas6 [Myxococcota bacterium]
MTQAPSPTPSPSLRIWQVECTLQALESVELPDYLGCTLRGGLGQAFRALACTVELPECSKCRELVDCPYGMMWEMPAPLGTPARYATPPRPYVIEPPLTHQGSFAPGERLHCTVKLMGRARRHLPYFILALREASHRGLGRGKGRLDLVEVRGLDPQGSPIRLYTGGKHRKLEADGILAETELSFDAAELQDEHTRHRVRLLLESPLQLKDGERLARELDPVVFTARLVERFDLLTLFYEGCRQSLPFEALKQSARQVRVLQQKLRWHHFERYSRRSGRVPMNGLLGEVELAEVPAALVSLWKMAEHLHVGKQSAFGFGRVRVEHIN